MLASLLLNPSLAAAAMTNPLAMKIRSRRRHPQAFTLLEVAILIVVLGAIAAIAIPAFIHARANHQKKTCIANLKDINSAKSSWALEQKKTAGDIVNESDIFGSAAYIRDKPACPGKGTYTLNPVGIKPRCNLETASAHSL
jgi:competence protein ComGC